MAGWGCDVTHGTTAAGDLNLYRRGSNWSHRLVSPSHIWRSGSGVPACCG